MSGVIGRNGGRPVGEPREATGNLNMQKADLTQWPVSALILSMDEDLLLVY